MTKICYLNWKGPQGRETVDQIDSEDFPDVKARRKEIARLISEYALAGMSGVYVSSRPCAGRN